MAFIRLTKEFNFEMAHYLTGYDGPCSNIHGHSYKLFVTLIGEANVEERHPKLGMVMDFGQLKAIVSKQIVSKLDHALLIHDTAESRELKPLLTKHFVKVEYVNYQPTCENLLVRFAELIKEELPENVQLHHLRLNETETSYAEWYYEDNK